MRILLACKIDTRGNPYTLQLLHALETHPDVEAVQHGRSWMEVPEAEFDIVHIHWPEELTNRSEPTDDDLRCLQSTLERWSTHSSIVVTVHNEYPHYCDTPAFRDLYQLVYKYAASVIHLGETSKEVVRRRYEREVDAATEAVIPHGNYDWFPNGVSRQEAREELNLENDTAVVLCFGSLRAREELDLLRSGFQMMQENNRHLLIAGSLPNRESRKDWRYWMVRLPVWTRPHITRVEKFIPRTRVQYYFNAADVVAVPRRNALNSGNVALGLSFGRVVVGPNQGVIGEELRKTGNPVFDPSIPSTLGEALQEGVKLAEQGHGEANRNYARETLSWSSVVDQHVALYKSTVKNHSTEA